MTLLKISSISMSLFFALAAGVQHNDPDCYIWLYVYIVPSSLTGVLAYDEKIKRSKFWLSCCMVHSVICLTSGLNMLIEYKTKSFDLRFEEGREFSGLMLVSVWLILLSLLDEKKKILLVLLTIMSLSPLILWSLNVVKTCADSS